MLDVNEVRLESLYAVCGGFLGLSQRNSTRPKLLCWHPLFSRGPTNWGQVVALFYFGYRLVIRRVRSGLLAAFRQVCKSLFSFCLHMNVFAWIAAQGGWRIVQYLTFSGAGARGDNEPANRTTANEQYTDTTGVTLLGQSWLTPQNLIVGLTIVCTALYLYRRFNR
ncbi:hypothetical protein EG68_07026 [Paragonimus skrjabini miyazakii]|uniref:Bcl-2 Bcl-2 homology region 1-3 domain-containing protein n=1 Tax=Paragonimus skrjabini miyazakii TaxID=59628 RepID=A0A8S9YN69_9TREM|nr:hypothetical protein EG68_07026 [Paragonimus skrjabini miyazakii]